MAGRGAPAGATFTIFGATSDAVVVSGPDGSYAAVHGGSAPRVLDSVAATTQTAGHYHSGGSYAAYEYFVAFDTSTVVGTITSVTLSLWGLVDQSSTDFTVQARVYDWGAAVDTSDFRTAAQFSALTLVATKATSGWVNGAYNDFTADAAFLTNINQAGLTKLVVCSSRFGTTPSALEYVQFASADTTGTANDPKLVVVTS